MLAKRIIPCLDVKDGAVVKGVQFRSHETVGDILTLAQRYRGEGADELVFYDICASSEGRSVDKSWVKKVASLIDIPFCVAGGLRTVDEVRRVLADGADKISINSPALENPALIDDLARAFGRQCVVVGIDSRFEEGDWWVYQYTGDETKTVKAKRRTMEWACEAVARGAGEIVLNCMNQDGMRRGYDLVQLARLKERINVPLIASGGAGKIEDFIDVFEQAKVDGALAASVFHKNVVSMASLKQRMAERNIAVRMS
jgi:cyclase